jgi:UDP-glucose 4-epimerase
MKILVTGGAGYIGSHVVVELLGQGHEVVVVDNLSNSSRSSISRVESITGKKVPLYVLDVADEKALEAVFAEHAIDAVIHFAALKAVGESVTKPLLYYRNNLDSTMALLNVMKKYKVSRLVFSSSACVYGVSDTNPIVESVARRPENPYGRTKLMIEEMLEDMTRTNEGWNITSLRYFNPIGAHPSGRIGEDPNGIPNNLLPYVSQVATGKRSELQVFGGDYDTPDGTGIRDYIHIMDLARAHVAALNHIEHPNVYKVYNIGTGKGYSVLQVISAFEKASSKKIPYKIVARRPGDVATCYCDPALALAELGWSAEFDLERACEDSWRWQHTNPDGYRQSVQGNML